MATKALENGKKSPQRANEATLGAFPDTDISIYVKLAEGGRFELPRRGLPACRFSRPVHSTALPPFHGHDERLVDPPGAR
jgi:hypothetical protein